MNSETPVKTPTAVQSEHVESSFLSTNLHKSWQRAFVNSKKYVTDRKVRTASGFCEKANVYSDTKKKRTFSWAADLLPASRDACWPKEFAVGNWCHEISHQLLPQHARAPDSLCICDEILQQVLYPPLITPSPQPPGWCVVGQRTYCRQGQRFLSLPKGLNQCCCAISLLTQECCICRLGNDNAFPPGQVQKEYCREGAMSVAPGVISCTAFEKKQQNLLCSLPISTDRSSLPDFQFESAMSGLGNK
jgi:hypothetical protein